MINGSRFQKRRRVEERNEGVGTLKRGQCKIQEKGRGKVSTVEYDVGERAQAPVENGSPVEKRT